MKKLFTIGLFLILIGIIFQKKNDIMTVINTYFFPENNIVTLDNKNEYYRDYNFDYVKNTTVFSPTNFQDVLNIYYTVINSGVKNFTFYCSSKYSDCLKDIEYLANDQDKLSDINNFVHPFNSFSHIETEYDSLGKIVLNIKKTYSDDEINLINSKIDELLPTLVTSDDMIQNIRNIHDFIINNTTYDSLRSDQNIFTYKSDLAYGPLFEGYGICGGYTDLMELFLERLGIKSYKVSSNNHVWNVVYLNDKWYHLDLTWDDPISNDGNNYLEHNYFLIDTNQLLNLDVTEHDFNKNVYKELKEAY